MLLLAGGRFVVFTRRTYPPKLPLQVRAPEAPRKIKSPLVRIAAHTTAILSLFARTKFARARVATRLSPMVSVELWFAVPGGTTYCASTSLIAVCNRMFTAVGAVAKLICQPPESRRSSAAQTAGWPAPPAELRCRRLKLHRQAKSNTEGPAHYSSASSGVSRRICVSHCPYSTCNVDRITDRHEWQKTCLQPSARIRAHLHANAVAHHQADHS
jgi:hypothetical protein